MKISWIHAFYSKTNSQCACLPQKRAVGDLSANRTLDLCDLSAVRKIDAAHDCRLLRIHMMAVIVLSLATSTLARSCLS